MKTTIIGIAIFCLAAMLMVAGVSADDDVVKEGIIWCDPPAITLKSEINVKEYYAKHPDTPYNRKRGMSVYIVSYEEKNNHDGVWVNQSQDFLNIYLGRDAFETYLIIESWKYDVEQGIKTCCRWVLKDLASVDNKLDEGFFQIIVEDPQNIILSHEMRWGSKANILRAQEFFEKTKKMLLDRVGEKLI